MIIYFDNGTNPFSKEFKNSGYKIVSPYNNGIKVKILRKLERIRFLRKYLYNAKMIKPESKENIIIFDSNITQGFLEWINAEYSDNRIIFWYWNPVESLTTTIFPNEIPEGIEKWSYSPEDCQKYKLMYNTTFLFDSLVQNEKKVESFTGKKKALFVGRDKGRLKELLHLKKILEKENIECEFHIIGNPQSNKYRYENPVAYQKVIDMIKQADILIDYYTDEMAGLSLRPMEALFFRKKLITNNCTISNYDFYNKNNIFMLNERERAIGEFVRADYVEISRNVQNQYLLSNWIERF